MTAHVGLRELPIRVPITNGESLHSWIEALASRYRMTVRELLPALGIPAPLTPYGLILGVDTQALRSLEWEAGLPVGRLDDAVLDRFSALDLAGTPGRAPHRGWQTLWAKSSGSRFCPRCLAENGGHWSLAWYLNWTFACMRHNVLMATRAAPAGVSRDLARTGSTISSTAGFAAITSWGASPSGDPIGVCPDAVPS